MRRRLFLHFPLTTIAAARPVAVIAHRGAHQHHAENSLAAIRAAIELGVDYVELDIRTTPKHALVLKHDALTAADGPLPSFDDALALLRASHASLYLDWKSAAPEAIARSLRRHNMLARTVVYGSVERLAALQQIEPNARVMPEAVSVGHLRQTIRTLHPRVIAFDRHDFQDPIIEVASAAKVDIFVDRLGPDDNEASWRDAIRRRATGIQTDKPAELLALLGYPKRG